MSNHGIYDESEGKGTQGDATVVMPVVEASEAFSTPRGGLRRVMKARHISLIAMGGTIGTGLFISSGNALQNGGPLGLLLGYMLIGTVCYFVMTALGEMISYLPVEGGIVTLATRFVDPSFGFALSFNYAYCFLFILPAELSAAAVLINYWITSVNDAVWITLSLLLVVSFNVLGARFYGEAEFWFASIKVLLIIGLILVSIAIDCGAGTGGYLGFRYWRDPGPLNQYADIEGSLGRFLGFWAVLIQAAFSFIGSETIAMTAAECENPRRTVSRAVKQIYTRIVLFYVLGMFAIGLVCPSNNERIGTASDAGASPFVIAIELAGIKVLPSIVNACLLTSVLSAASADIYISSRTLYGIAKNGDLPKFFLRTSRNGLPYACIAVSICFSFLSYMCISEGAAKVFNWFASMCAMTGITSWFSICVMYLRFNKGMAVQGISRDVLPYKNPIAYYGCYFSLVVIILATLTSAWTVFLRGKWDTATFVTNYLPMALFPLLYCGKKIIMRTKLVSLHEMDFMTGIEEIEADCYEVEPPKTILGKILGFIV